MIQQNYITTDEIKVKADILEIISESVKLTRKGNRYWGLCPFHDEKTPSFSVIPSKNLFYCFGCHTSGDPFTFIQKQYNLTFVEAKIWLAERYGISTHMSEKARISAREAWRQQQRQKRQEDFARSIIKLEYHRLCSLERNLNRIIGNIGSEKDLDSPEVIIALQNRTQLESFIDDWFKADEAERFTMALQAREVF